MLFDALDLQQISAKDQQILQYLDTLVSKKLNSVASIANDALDNLQELATDDESGQVSFAIKHYSTIQQMDNIEDDILKFWGQLDLKTQVNVLVQINKIAKQFKSDYAEEISSAVDKLRGYTELISQIAEVSADEVSAQLNEVQTGLSIELANALKTEIYDVFFDYSKNNDIDATITTNNFGAYNPSNNMDSYPNNLNQLFNNTIKAINFNQTVADVVQNLNHEHISALTNSYFNYDDHDDNFVTDYLYKGIDYRDDFSFINDLDKTVNINILDKLGNTPNFELYNQFTQQLVTPNSNGSSLIKYTNLPKGNYLIKVSSPISKTDDPSISYYKFNLTQGDSQVVTTQSADLAGNSIKTAFKIPTLFFDQTESVSSTDKYDYYKFTVKSSTKISVNLSGLTANADLYVINNKAKTLKSSKKSGTATEAINNLSLESGTYYIKIQSNDKSKAEYKLNLSSSTTTAKAAIAENSGIDLSFANHTKLNLNDTFVDSSFKQLVNQSNYNMIGTLFG